MSELTFYQQRRYDGGTRIGIQSGDGSTLLGLFHEGRPDMDDDPLASALEWYVDLRCKGATIPDDPEGARNWLLSRASVFQPVIANLADQVEAGWDANLPLTWSRFEGLGPGVEARLVCSAVRRITDRSLSGVIRQFGLEYEGHLRSLQPLASVLD